MNLHEQLKNKEQGNVPKEKVVQVASFFFFLKKINAELLQKFLQANVSENFQ